jgi:hypothetical protein
MVGDFVSVAAKSALPTAAGGMAGILGEMAGLSGLEWAVLLAVILGSTIAGAEAARGSVEADTTISDDEKRRRRRLGYSTLAAQILFGVVVAAQANGNLWITIPACLAIGWTGNAFLQSLARRMGLGGDK